ncbi:MAG: glycoside hydrolase family 3 N-terminal domain-containing protein [Stappiaceae bacterium]
MIFTARHIAVLSSIAIFAVLGIAWWLFSIPTQTAGREPQPASPLEAMIGQMIIVGFDGETAEHSGVQSVAGQIADNKVGGVLLLGRNVQSASQLSALTDFLNRQPASRKPFIAIDQEGGKVQRLRNIDGIAQWSSAVEVAEQNSAVRKDYAFDYYADRARDLRGLGINFNLGPVVDLNINPGNPIIGKLDRSYSEDPQTVTELAGAFVRAHRLANVLTSLKHFPGHGSSKVDSHYELPDITVTWDKAELEPYVALAQADMIDTVMTGHLVHNAFSDLPDIPVSLSRKGMSALRAIIGDRPVIITDDLQMRAILDHQSDEEAAVRAVLAGNDLLVFSSHQRAEPGLGDRINLAIRKAVDEGRVPVETVARSYLRILALKKAI